MNKDLIGKEFGHLTVIDYDETEKKWICKCDCGNITRVVGTNLKTGNTKSCGCRKNGKGIKNNRKINLLHQQIGQLQVNKIDSTKDVAICKCLNCGNEVEIPILKLVDMKKSRKKTFTCEKNGCIYKKGKNTGGIKKGTRFGNLIVQKRTDNKVIQTKNSISSIPTYICKCDCGNEVEIQGRYLLDGRTQSCGCLKEKNFKKKHSYGKMTSSKTGQELYKIFNNWQKKYRQPTKLFKKKIIDKNIKFFPEMANDPFENFHQWAIANGFSISQGKIYLDRKDYNKDFSNTNCFWTDKKTKGY